MHKSIRPYVATTVQMRGLPSPVQRHLRHDLRLAPALPRPQRSVQDRFPASCTNCARQWRRRRLKRSSATPSKLTAPISADTCVLQTSKRIEWTVGSFATAPTRDALSSHCAKEAAAL